VVTQLQFLLGLSLLQSGVKWQRQCKLAVGAVIMPGHHHFNQHNDCSQHNVCNWHIDYAQHNVCNWLDDCDCRIQHGYKFNERLSEDLHNYKASTIFNECLTDFNSCSWAHSHF